MALGRQETSEGRGERGTVVVKEGSPPEPAAAWVATLDDLDEICGWLGTFRERLQIARKLQLDDTNLAEVTDRLDARLRRRRAELS